MADNYGGSENSFGEDDQIGDEGDGGESGRQNGSEDYSSSSSSSQVEKINSDEELEEDEEEEQSNTSNKNYEVVEEEVTQDKPNQNRITSPFMTKYEKARIIGVRAVQISKNSPLYLNNQNVANMNWDPLTIAEKELNENKIPFIIRRFLPDGSFQDWKVSELKTFD